MAAKKKIEPKVLTRDEQIEHAFANARKFEDIGGMFPAPPPNRRLTIGQDVEIGNLENCKVVKVSEDGLFVVVELDDLDTSYGKHIYLGRRLGAWPWTSVIPKDDQMPTALAHDAWIGAYSNTQLSDVLSRVMFRDMEDSPDYQRGYVWTDDDKVQLIDAIFNARDIGKFVFVKHPFPKGEEILDGKQRLSTIVDFIASKFPYEGKYWHELSKHDRYQFEGRQVQYTEIQSERLNREQRLRIFLAINSAGVPQTEEHLAKVKALLAEEVAKTAKRTSGPKP